MAAINFEAIGSHRRGAKWMIRVRQGVIPVTKFIELKRTHLGINNLRTEHISQERMALF